MSSPRPVPGLLDIAPYVGGRASAPGAAKVFKLSSNESPLGPSPKAMAAYAAAASQLAIYPEGSAAAMRQAIGGAWGLNPERIICGNGSDEILHLITQCYCEPGDEVLFSEHGFAVYPIAARAASAVPVTAAETNLTGDVNKLIAKLTAKTKVVFVANPNNPTGTYLPASEIRRLHAAIRPDTLLVLDAAYAEYVKKNDYEAGVELAATASNVIMTRTLSKAYGLAGLRIGWAFGPEAVIDALNRARPPFNVSIPAQAAAVAAMADGAFLEASVAHNDEWLPWLTERIEATGLSVTPSVCNFLLVHFPKTPGKTAAEADAFLMKRGLILRGVASYGLPDALRLSVGTEEANRAVAAALADFMAA
jgi:histidinol-phosphate aminotransferase